MISSQELDQNVTQDDIDFLVDLGLIERSTFRPANAIYEQVFPRLHSSIPWIETIVRNHNSQLPKSTLLHSTTNALYVDRVLMEFKSIWSKNHDLYSLKTLEAFPEGLFYALFWNLLDNEGTIEHQYALGSGTVSIRVEKPLYGSDRKQVVVIGFRRFDSRTEETPEEVEKQLANQVEILGLRSNAKERYGVILNLRTSETRKQSDADADGTVKVFWI